MEEIGGIEARLAAALDRIARGVEQVPEADAGTAAAAEVEKLRGALKAEQEANTRLTERVQAIREKQEQMVEALEQRVLRLQERVSQQEGELARLRQVNAALRDNAEALRKAAVEGGVSAGMIDQALAAELEATRAAQAADRSELEAILAELKPLIEEKADV